MLRSGTLALLLATPALGDEAFGPGGRTLTGTLVLSGGQLALLRADGRALARGADLGEVRLAGVRRTFAATPAHVARLPGDESLTGVFVGAQGAAVVLRTAWSERLVIPHAALAALTGLPGLRTV